MEFDTPSQILHLHIRGEISTCQGNHRAHAHLCHRLSWTDGVSLIQARRYSAVNFQVLMDISWQTCFSVYQLFPFCLDGSWRNSNRRTKSRRPVIHCDHGCFRSCRATPLALRLWNAEVKRWLCSMLWPASVSWKACWPPGSWAWPPREPRSWILPEQVGSGSPFSTFLSVFLNNAYDFYFLICSSTFFLLIKSSCF